MRYFITIFWAILAASCLSLATLLLVVAITDSIDSRIDSKLEELKQQEQSKSFNDLFYAIWMVESNGQVNPPDGDGGKSIGPFQITKPYWQDADMPYGVYEDCRKLDYAMEVMERYWKLYVPEAYENKDFEILARVHNGGPNGADKKHTLRYWYKINDYLE